MHCEHKTKNITVAADSLAVSGGVSASDYTAIDSYAYWEQVNENRRFINLINVAHLSTIQTATRNLLRKTPR
jgi:exo-beta-1,3-glucanase (GH17 family)